MVEHRRVKGNSKSKVLGMVCDLKITSPPGESDVVNKKNCREGCKFSRPGRSNIVAPIISGTTASFPRVHGRNPPPRH
ncbi:uncharacterized protein ARMOST_13728 [Armillaria ostoyae]|uniref:Uncharacterized protein n=1 Tax=Armillaria ostoyae TaxID=47428 RepID=A0A284RNP1_ARMOS|nr:uncharacterized protein ARMOST_13728 [Armillaria ostoyae]